MKNSIDYLKKTFVLLLCVFALSAFDTPERITTNLEYPGTNVRGRVVNAYSVPLGGLSVTVWVYNAYGWQQLAATYTDVYGFYYFQYLQPGNYTIQVNGARNYDVHVIQIDYNYYSFQDLPLFYF